jgi:cystathionine gamma-synthase
LADHPKVTKVWHPSVPSHPSHELAKKQMKGPPACFSFELATEQAARTFPKKLKLFADATSLGGVESLIDYRLVFRTFV